VTTTSAIPMTVDGVRLDTYAYNIETIEGRITVPGVRGANPQVPGRHGSIYVPNKSYENGSVVLKMWVNGCDVDGAVPTTGLTEFRKNVDTLTALFTKRPTLLDVRQTWPAGVRQALCEVLGAYDLSARAIQPYGKFSVALDIPGTFWQDVSTTDYASATNLAPAVTLTVATHAGMTAPMDDAIVVVRGPATNPRVTDLTTGSWVQYSGTIASGTDWQIDCANWTSKTGSALLYGTGGTSVVGATSHSGLVGTFLSLSPLTGGPSIRLDGSTFGTNTQVQIRGRKKYLT